MIILNNYGPLSFGSLVDLGGCWTVQVQDGAHCWKFPLIYNFLKQIKLADL